MDELPELFNILKGDMSFIGPRPLLVQYLPLYNQEQRKRHDVRPGMSGFAQVSGRNTLSWQDKFKMDVDYVENLSFIGDIKLIVKTLQKIVLREGINSETAVTMEPFNGSEQGN
jgi:lipopolysaccharide/colanic/teichoic acid biosynthesis glycosyltransferase